MKKTALALALGFSANLAMAADANDYGIVEFGAFGGQYSLATGVSADGGVVVGVSGAGVVLNGFPTSSQAFCWRDGVMTDLGTLGGDRSIAYGVSADGGVVVGASTTTGDGGVSGFHPHAYRWRDGVMTDLGTLGGSDSRAYGVSADGSVVVGESSVPNGDSFFYSSHAFRWVDGVMSDLGTLGGTNSLAMGVSADGSVVVGASDTIGDAYSYSFPNSNIHAFRWADGVMSDLGTGGGTWSWAWGVSADGSVVVGAIGASEIEYTTSFPYLPIFTTHAFRWEDGVMADLGTLGGTNSWAYGVSADGRVVVGSADTAAEASRAFRWTERTGMQTVEDWLRASGVVVPADITRSAFATNSDGSVVVGQLQSGTAFVARGDSGLVSLADVQDSLAGTARGGSLALTSTDTTLNGAHSRPLARRVGAGQKTFWLAGDWGRDDHGARDGDLGLAEFGLGHNLGPVQLNFSLGQTWARQNQVLGGRTRTEGNYLLAEALIPLSDRLWAVLGGYGHWGEADIRRGYLNAGLPDASTGTPGVTTWGLRARLEAEAAWRLAGAGLSPYADLSYVQSRLDAYSETGGGFPASFDRREEHATELRLGMNAFRPLGNRLNLVGILEAAHRFEQNGAGTSGQVIGLFGFNLPGQKNDRDWLRAGAGLEGRLGGGTASLMLNVTTRGEAPNCWLAAAWQKAF